MNHIALDKLRFNAKLLMTMLVMLTLSMFAIHSQAAQADVVDTGDNTQARFNHMTTGFPLTGAHAIADCGSCHVGGVFKGTPRNCNGCHIKGQRVVAIDMPAMHIATTQQCDVCHTNTVTFFGAYYNHGLAVPGQCTSCHNGSVTTGRPSSHNIAPKSTASCDNCHRSTAWLPSFFLHTGVIGNCSSCHLNAQAVGASNVRNSISGTSPEAFAHGAQNSSLDCKSCHTDFSTWYGAMYDHASAGGLCSSCHNGSRATGTAQFSGHLITTSDCGTCHHGYSSWLGATFDHSGIGSAACSSCHNGVIATGKTPLSGTSPEAFAHNSQNNAIDCGGCHKTTANWLGALYDHVGAAGTCATCHNGTRATGFTQAIALYSGHTTSGECSTCHSLTTTWLGASGGKPTNHIPYNSGIACTACHVSDYVTPVNTNTMHSLSSSSTCATCHISPNAYTGSPNTQQTRSSHSGSSGSNCTGCHSHSNAGSYTSWGG